VVCNRRRSKYFFSAIFVIIYIISRCRRQDFSHTPTIDHFNKNHLFTGRSLCGCKI